MTSVFNADGIHLMADGSGKEFIVFEDGLIVNLETLEIIETCEGINND